MVYWKKIKKNMYVLCRDRKTCVHKITTLSTNPWCSEWIAEHDLAFVLNWELFEIPKTVGSIERVQEVAEQWLVDLIIKEGYVGGVDTKELYEDILKELGEKK